ncbi:MAG: hypothetical protein ACREQK_19340 [Candidatus Binatia bacterium]
MRISTTVFYFIAFSLSLGLTACSAQRPVLYPNERMKQVGTEAAERDINDCMRRGEQYVESGGRAGEVAGKAAAGTGAGAAIGGAAGGAGGAAIGHAGRGAAAGAAGGAAAGLTRAMLQGFFEPRGPDPALRNFVTRCLSEKGYDVVGWK